MLDNITVHYAIQTCDIKNYQIDNRFCNTSRTILSKKSLLSIYNAIKYVADNKPSTSHYINIIEDNCTDELLDFIQNLLKNNLYKNIFFELTSLRDNTGIANSIEYCYNWLSQNGKYLVFQIQDDYLFSIDSIYQSIDIYFQILYNLKTEPVVQPFNDHVFWNDYQYTQTPRFVFLGKKNYWIQIYDTSCSFLTSHSQFIKHGDLYKKFFYLVEKKISTLESRSLNYMFTQRGVLGVTPLNTLTHHIQDYPDPYVNWKELWNSLSIENT